MAKMDSVFRMRSLGTATAGISDQYADGKAAKVWQMYIGDQNTRTENYRSFLVKLLREKRVVKVLDAACGTGVDSVMLLEEGFEMVSSDASDKMLKTAYKTRWERRKEAVFERWVIEEANWLSLLDDVEMPPGGFDALVCMGNSFAHLPDFHGDQRDQIKCIENFKAMVKPGGIFIIDHRNYDYILEHGKAPSKNIYYNSHHVQDILLPTQGDGVQEPAQDGVRAAGQALALRRLPGPQQGEGPQLLHPRHRKAVLERSVILCTTIIIN